MITDNLKNASMYYNLGDGMKAALKYLEATDFTNMESGKYEVDGSKVFALVQEYQSKLIDQGKWESHRKYIDIQYVFKGIEKIGYTNIDNMTILNEYDDVKDFLLLSGEGDFITVNQGGFAIFGPQDAHMPGIAINNSTPVKKVVMKVLVE